MSTIAPPDSMKELFEKINTAKQILGKDLVILAHFYQNDGIAASADFIGDSLQLAQSASRQVDAKYILFCAVTFMAEMARILCRPEQVVLHPEPAAKCPLAEMADIRQVEQAWQSLQIIGKTLIPVVYVNSKADLKAFCGKNGGFVCTSSNAHKAMGYVLTQGAIPFFFPDENLGRNTAAMLGIPDDDMLLWDPYEEPSKAMIKGKDHKVILWRGFCYVHKNFKTSDIEDVRRLHDNIRVIVHPECVSEVVRMSDYAGSTAFIKNTVEAAPAGSKWAIGTEINFVNRIQRDNPDKLIVPLKEYGCREMAKITASKCLTTVENIINGKPQPEVIVDPATSEYAKIALERMLNII